MISGLYAAFFALIQIRFTMNVVKIRRGEKVSIGDGGKDHLLRAVRGHGNFTETVPIFLILLVISEMSGAPFWTIHVLGVLMIAGRLAHYRGLSSGTGHGKFRFYGMVASVAAIASAALLCLWLSVPLLLPAA